MGQSWVRARGQGGALLGSWDGGLWRCGFAAGRGLPWGRAGRRVSGTHRGRYAVHVAVMSFVGWCARGPAGSPANCEESETRWLSEGQRQGPESCA